VPTTHRVLIVEGTGNGFISHYSHALALGLHQQGQRVTLLTGQQGELAEWTPPFTRQAVALRGMRGVLSLARCVRRWQPTLIHLQWVDAPLLMLALVQLWRRRGIRVIFTPHNLLPHCGRWRCQPAFSALYRALDHIVVRDPKITWGLEELFGLSQDHTTLIGDNPNLLSHPLLPERLPQQLQRLPATARCMLFFGYGGSKKGIADLLAAWRQAASDFTLVLAGREVARAITGIQLSDQERQRLILIDRYIHPFEVRSLIRHATLMVLPYRKQCHSPVLDLALDLGVPVIRSDRVWTQDFVEGVDGMTFPAGAVDRLSRLIREQSVNLLVTSPRAPQQLLAQTVRRHLSLYDWVSADSPQHGSVRGTGLNGMVGEMRR